MNVIVQLDFKLSHFKAAVQYFSHYAIDMTLTITTILSQSGPGSNGSIRVTLHSPKLQTWILSPRFSFVSYSGKFNVTWNSDSSTLWQRVMLPVRFPSIGQTDLFKSHSYLIGGFCLPMVLRNSYTENVNVNTMNVIP